MKIENNLRGFEMLTHPMYADEKNPNHPRMAGQSSQVGNYEDSLERPGSSFLWVGEWHHLNREEVLELRNRLSRWLETGSLRLEGEE